MQTPNVQTADIVCILHLHSELHVAPIIPVVWTWRGGQCDNTTVTGDTANSRHSQLLNELKEEKVAALRRISGTLESLIRQLQLSRDRIRRATGAEREREMAVWQALRERAIKYRWYLEVQREAVGVRRHDVLDEFYQLPTLE
jgi:hypothetical protein